MKKRILIADDDPSLREIFQIILEKAGYDLEIKDDANEIFQNQFRVPDVFLVDKLLSGIDGLDICQYLKNDARTSHVPVIMVSATPDIGIEATRAGADDFIEKPFDVIHLLHVIERNLNDSKNGKPLKKVS
ncbi:MAG TPA: response regulator [Chitinophagaceae bacterium]